MHRGFIVGIIASLGLLTLGFEASGVESPAPNFGTSSSSEEVTIRLPYGRDVRIGRKLAALIAEGGAASLRGRYDRAISCFSAALHANHDRNVAFVIYSARASAYYWNGELRKALSDSSAAIQLNSQRPSAYLDRGHAYRELGDNDEAINDYTAAIHLDPKHQRAYYNRAIVYGNKRQYKQAIRDCTMAIHLNPKDADAYHNRGVYYLETGDLDKAVVDFSQAIRFNPRDVRRTFLSRAVACEYLEKFDKAIADYDRVIRITAKDSNDYVARGTAYFSRGNYERAASDFEKAVRLSQNNDNALHGLALLRATCPESSLRNGKEAIRMSMRACELTKWKNPDDILALAAAYAEIGDFAKAVKYQTQGIKMKSDYGRVQKKTRERLALYQDHKPARAEPLVAH
jgi:tetratricopeptide (TPR) repeat protein